MEANRKQVSKKTPKRDEAAKRADKRTAKIGGWTGSQNDVTDGIFGDFCAKLGVNHIRDSEGTTMQEQQAAHAKTMDLTKHVQTCKQRLSTNGLASQDWTLGGTRRRSNTARRK